MSDQPKTLDEAVYRAMAIGPMNGMHGRICWALKDFLRLKFLSAHPSTPEEAKLLKELLFELLRAE